MVYSWLRKPQFLVFIPLVLLLVFALACGDDPTPTPKPTAIPVPATDVPPTAVPPTATPAPTAVPTVSPPVPKYGGVINMDRGGPPASLDPHRGANIEAGSAIAPILNGVLSFDALNPTEIIGDLAKDWVVSDDGLEWTFTLNENIKWQDGVDLTAHDIAFNVMRMIEPDEARPKIFALQRWIDRAEVIDPLTVKVINKKPGLTWLTFLALPYSGIMPKHLLETGVDFDVFDNVVGSGPFKGLDSVEGVSFEFEKNLTYWKEGLPYLDGIKAFAIGSAGTLIAAFETGRIDMCTWVCININMDDVVRLKADESFSEKHDILIMEGLSGTGIAMNTEIAPFNDVRVRRALFLAAHRQPIAETMGRGFFPIGYISDPSSQWSLPMDEILSTPGYRELDGKNHPDDIAEAKALLKAAGQENFTGTIIAPTVVGLDDFIQLYAQQLKETLGIDLEPRPLPLPDWITRSAGGDFFMTTQGGSPTIQDPDDRFRAIYTSAQENWSRWSDPALEALFAKQTEEPDPVKRKEIVFEMQRLVLGGGPGRIEFYWLVLAQIVNKKIMTEAGQYVLPFRANAGPYRHEHEWLEPE